MLAAQTVGLLAAGLGGVVMGLLAGGAAGAWTMGVALITTTLVITIFLLTPYCAAVGNHPLGTAASMVTGLLSLVAPVLFLWVFSWVPETQVMVLAPLILSCFTGFSFYIWLLPMDAIGEAFRVQVDTEQPQGPGFLGRLLNFARGSSQASALANGDKIMVLEISKREISAGTHFSTLFDVITSAASWVVASLVLAPMMPTWEKSAGLTLIGLCAAILGAAEMFRRNRLAEYAPAVLPDNVWNIVRLRRFATKAMFWAAVSAGAEFALCLLMVNKGAAISAGWASVMTTISILWPIFAIAGVLMILGSFVLLGNVARNEKGWDILSSSAGAGAVLVVGLLVATVGLHSYGASHTLGGALELDRADRLIEQYGR